MNKLSKTKPIEPDDLQEQTETKTALSLDISSSGISSPAVPPQMQPFAAAVTLLMASGGHKHLFLTDLEWMLVPPLKLGQFRLVQKEGKPIALVTWAFVSEEVEQRLKAGNTRLRPADWKSGDTCYIIDLVAPFGGSKEVIKMLKEGPLADQKFNRLRRDPKTGGPLVETIVGAAL